MSRGRGFDPAVPAWDALDLVPRWEQSGEHLDHVRGPACGGRWPVAIRYARRMVAVPAAALAAVLGATPVLAAATWTVQPGGPVSLTSARFTLKDTKTGAILRCPGQMSGTLKSGSGLPGTGIGSITAAGFPQCGGGLPPKPDVVAAALPWHLNVISYNATTGVVIGRVSHVRILLKSR